jgi:cytochrome b involved in lipid metabolism
MAKRNRKSLQQGKNKGSKKKKGGKKKIFTKEEVSRHNHDYSTWIIFSGKVYDCTKYLELNPGCIDIITTNAGYDATEDFVAVHSSKKKATKMLEDFYIGELQPTPVAAIIPVHVIGRVDKLSDMSKLLGSEEQLFVHSPWWHLRPFNIEFSTNVFNMIMTDNIYYFRRVRPWIQMKDSLKIIDIDVDNDTARALIRSTNSFPNLKAIKMRQPTDRKRSHGVVLNGWVSLWDSLYGDDNICVKTNPKLKRISIKPGVLAEERNLVALKAFVELNSDIEHMDVICHECYEDRFHEKTCPITQQAEGIVLSIVNNLAMNRALALNKTAMKGDAIASFKLEEVFATSCCINVFDRDQSLYSRGMGPVRETDDISPTFEFIKCFAPERNFRTVNEASLLANVEEASLLANVDEANVDESTVLTDATILTNVSDFRARIFAYEYDGEYDDGEK